MKFFRKIYDESSLILKFSTLYTLLIIIPIIIVGFISYRYTVNTSVQQAMREDAQHIQDYKRSIQTVISNTEVVMDGVVFISDTRTYLNDSFFFTYEERNHFTYQVQNELIRIKKMYPNLYDSIRFFSSNNSLGEMNDFLYSLDRIESTEIYDYFLKSYNRTRWGPIKVHEEYRDVNALYDDGNDALVVPYYYRVSSYKNNELIGIVEVDIQLDKMFMNAYYDDSVYVFDEAGALLPVDVDNHQLIGHLDLVEDSGAGIFERNIDGIDYWITYEEIPELNCRIAVVRSQEMIINSINDYERQLITIVLLSIIVSFIIIYIVTRFMFTNFNALVETIDRIRGGELSARLNEDGGEEVRKLAHHFNLLLDELDEAVNKLMEKEMAQRKAEIRALQSQVNPHFLYNTLDSVRMQCEIREEYDLADVLISISCLFRYNTKWTNDLVSIGEEIEHTNNYMTIMRARFEGKIVYSNNVDQEIHQFKTIKMILQPIVENCFKYAFNQKQGDWRLQLDGYQEDNNIRLEIKDNGSGIEKNRLQKISRLMEENENNVEKESVGLWNLNRRIRIHFGEQYGIRIHSIEGDGTTIIVRLPVIRE